MSKRNLYKPAPSQTPPRVARRSLTQGRLVSTDPRSLMNNVSPSEPKQSSQPLQSMTIPRARRSLEYNSANSATICEARPPSYQISPTILKSPAPVKPSSSLSLSDTEEQTIKTHQVETSKEILIEPTVLTIDASQRSRLKDNEVPIKTSYMKSPVKVVCHSPLRQNSRSMTDNSQYYAHAGKINVPVENVPTINMSHDNIPKTNESPSSSSPRASEDCSLSTIAGSPVDPRSKAIETVVVREKNNPRSYVSFLDAEDDSGTGSDVITLSDLHMRQPTFDDTAISSIGGDSTLSSIGEETRKKKRKPRVVQSKYMTSAMSRMGQIASATKVFKRPDSRLKISTANRVTSATSKVKKTKSKGSSKLAPIKEREKIKETRTVPQFTSTPSEVTHPGITSTSEHVPIITPAPNRSEPYGAFLLTPSFFTPSKDQSRKKKTNVSHDKAAKTEQSAPTRQGKQATSDVSQVQLDLQYARLCQWRFLRSKFKHTFEKQEKDAQKQMYSSWLLNEELRKKNCELRVELETKRKREELDHQLELQLSWLKSVDQNSSRLIPDYHGLFEGIDTTRHHVPVKDILLPENEADLVATLNSCENILGEITSLLMNDEAKVLSFSKEMQVLADTLQEERKEHDRCTELLAAASTLTSQEKSLQAELIQRKEF